MMRAKMRVQSVEQQDDGDVVKMSAVSGSKYGTEGESEDNTYARYTPAGELSLTINNPDLVGKFREGQTFHLDFTEVK